MAGENGGRDGSGAPRREQDSRDQGIEKLQRENAKLIDVLDRTTRDLDRTTRDLDRTTRDLDRTTRDRDRWKRRSEDLKKQLDEARRTTAAVCMLMVEALLSTSNKPCESYQDGDPLLQTSQVRAKNDRTFEIALENAEARDIVKSCADHGHGTEETTIRTMICVGLATHVVFGQSSTGTIH